MTLLFLISSYLIGAIPTGYIFYRLSEKKDIRSFGSHATGATNVMRLKGWKYAILVAVFDILKGFLPVFFALKWLPDKNMAYICGFLSILGHCFPVYIKFKGGKGVATTVGVYAATAVIPLLIILGIFLIVVFFSRFVSLGSILAAMFFPLLAIIQQGPITVVYQGIAIFLLILFRHKENIKRLVNGNERKFGERI